MRHFKLFVAYIALIAHNIQCIPMNRDFGELDGDGDDIFESVRMQFERPTFNCPPGYKVSYSSSSSMHYSCTFTTSDGRTETKRYSSSSSYHYDSNDIPQSSSSYHYDSNDIPQSSYSPQVPPPRTAEPTVDPWKYKESGDIYMENRDFEKAIRQYTEGIDQNPDNVVLKALLFQSRAKAMFLLENYDECLKDIKESLKIQPENGKALWMAGCCYENMPNLSRKKQLERSIKYYEKAASFSYQPSQRELGHFDSLEQLLISKKYELAIIRIPTVDLDDPQYSRRPPSVQEEEPPSVEDLKKQGKSLSNRGEYDEAVKKFSEALELEQDLSQKARLLKERAKAYFHLKNYKNCIADATKSLQLRPKKGELFWLRGKCYQKMSSINLQDRILLVVKEFQKATMLNYKPTSNDLQGHETPEDLIESMKLEWIKNNPDSYYAIVGVDPTMGYNEIKSQYRKRALYLHPDRNSDADADEKFKELKKAYDDLSDETKRNQYEQRQIRRFERALKQIAYHRSY